MVLDKVITEYLKDPLLVEKGYLKADEWRKINFRTIPQSNKMLQVIKVIVEAKFNDETDAKTTRDVNNIFPKQ